MVERRMSFRRARSPEAPKITIATGSLARASACWPMVVPDLLTLTPAVLRVVAS